MRVEFGSVGAAGALAAVGELVDDEASSCSALRRQASRWAGMEKPSASRSVLTWPAVLTRR